MAFLATQTLVTSLKRDVSPCGCPGNSYIASSHSSLSMKAALCHSHQHTSPSDSSRNANGQPALTRGLRLFPSILGLDLTTSHKKQHTGNTSQHGVAFHFLSSGPQRGRIHNPPEVWRKGQLWGVKFDQSK